MAHYVKKSVTTLYLLLTEMKWTARICLTLTIQLSTMITVQGNSIVLLIITSNIVFQN